MAPTRLVFYVGTGTFSTGIFARALLERFTGCFRWSVARIIQRHGSSVLLLFLPYALVDLLATTEEMSALSGALVALDDLHSLRAEQQDTAGEVRCPKCNAKHEYVPAAVDAGAPDKDDAGGTNHHHSRSKDLQVFYSGTLSCSQCTKECSSHQDDDARMFVLSCGHLVCARDLEKSGGTIGDDERRRVEPPVRQVRWRRTRQFRPSIGGIALLSRRPSCPHLGQGDVPHLLG